MYSCSCFLDTAAVRLRGNNFTHIGRVEIKQGGFWHAICSTGWEKHDADVVCRQLGFPEAVLEVAQRQFGYEVGLLWMTSVRCQGNETSLDQCVSADWKLEPECAYKHVAGVVCKIDNVTSGNTSGCSLENLPKCVIYKTSSTYR